MTKTFNSTVARWTETAQSAVLMLMVGALPLAALSFVARSL